METRVGKKVDRKVELEEKRGENLVRKKRMKLNRKPKKRSVNKLKKKEKKNEGRED